MFNKCLDDDTLNAARKHMHRKRIVFDMCDNHFRTEYESYHRKMIDIADMVTCPTEAMHEVIGGHTGVWPTVIPDPHEFEMVEPSYVGTCDLLWYGNKTSVPALTALGNIELSTIGINNELFPLLCIGGDMACSIPYSRRNMLRAFGTCNAVIIPQVDDWWGSTKSPNRLLEAVARGRFVLANSIHSYEPFREWMWIGNIAKGLEWLKQQSGEEICNRIKKAQEYIRLNHSIEVVGDKWETALTSVVESTTGKAS